MPDPFGLGLGGVAVGGVSGGGIALALIDRTAGVNIGNMTVNGGLAAAFDGQASEVSGDCAVVQATAGFVGKTLAAPAIFGRATVHGANNNGGFTNSGAGASVVLEIYGKTGAAPANATDGTQLATLSITNQNDESAGRTLVSTDTVTAWDHLWVRIRLANNNNVFFRCAELVLHEVVA